MSSLLPPQLGLGLIGGGNFGAFCLAAAGDLGWCIGSRSCDARTGARSSGRYNALRSRTLPTTSTCRRGTGSGTAASAAASSSSTVSTSSMPLPGSSAANRSIVQALQVGNAASPVDAVIASAVHPGGAIASYH